MVNARASLIIDELGVVDTVLGDGIGDRSASTERQSTISPEG